MLTLQKKNNEKLKMNKEKPPRPLEGNLKTAGMPTVPIYGGVAFASNDGVVLKSKII